MGFGRFGETALLIMVALRPGPLRPARLLDEVRALDGLIGPGSLFGAVARLESLGLIESVPNGEGLAAYRLTGQSMSTHPVRGEQMSR